MCTAFTLVEDEVFKPSRVELVNDETKEILVVDDKGKTTIQKPQAECEEEVKVEQTLYIKEKFNISNKAYHELSMVNKTMPRSCTVTKCARELDSHSQIKLTPGNTQGVQQSLKVRLTKRLEILLERKPAIRDCTNVRVKITGDGTRISRNLHTVVIAFSLLEEGDANAPSGSHSIAIMNLSEDYEELAESLQDIMKEVDSLNTITVDNTDFSIELFLGADLKFLATVVGVQSANATYACVWCKCPADKRYDTSVQWSIADATKGARTIDEIKQFCSRLSKHGVEIFGCIKEPLFSSIPIDHIIPDILHLFLRISDILTNLLILELRRLDGIEKQVKALNRDKATNVTQYEHFLNHQCKISFQWYSVLQVSCHSPEYLTFLHYGFCCIVVNEYYYDKHICTVQTVYL